MSTAHRNRRPGPTISATPRLAVILVIVVGTVRLIGSQANNVFSQTGSAIASS